MPSKSIDDRIKALQAKKEKATKLAEAKKQLQTARDNLKKIRSQLK